METHRSLIGWYFVFAIRWVNWQRWYLLCYESGSEWEEAQNTRKVKRLKNREKKITDEHKSDVEFRWNENVTLIRLIRMCLDERWHTTFNLYVYNCVWCLYHGVMIRYWRVSVSFIVSLFVVIIATFQTLKSDHMCAETSQSLNNNNN